MTSAGRTHADRSRYFVWGAFRRFFVPAIISSLWIALAGIADCFIVGNSIGTNGLAAIALGQPIYLFYNILSYGMSIGGSIHYASKLAEGREEEGNRIFHSVLRLLICVYALTATLALAFLPQLMRLLGADPNDAVVRTYIRTQLCFVPIMFCQGPFYYFVNADNNPALASAAMSLSALTDIVLNYILLIRLRVGVAGSVYSTAAGAVLMLCITGSHILRKKGALRFRWVRMDWRGVARAATTGFATSARYLCEFVTVIAVNRILISIAGEAGVASFDVIYNISALFAAVTDAAAVATEPMLSSYRSERNIGNIRTTLQVSLVWAAVMTLLFAVVLSLAADPLSVRFGMVGMPEHGYTVTGIRVYVLSVGFSMLNALFTAYYQSIFRERWSYLITFLRSFLFYLLSLFVCSRHGMDYFWFFFVMTEGLTLAAWSIPLLLGGDPLQLRSIDTSNVKSIFIDSSEQDLTEVIEDVQAFCEERGCGPRQVMYIGLTIEEIACAIFDRFREQMGDIYIQITVVAEEDSRSLYIRDNAYVYNPMEADTGTIDLEEGREVSLLGINIVQKSAEEFYYRRYSGFNTLVLRL